MAIFIKINGKTIEEQDGIVKINGQRVITERELEIAINRNCTCGGSGPGESSCVACAIWHELMTRENG